MVDFLSGLPAPKLELLAELYWPDERPPAGAKALSAFAATLSSPGRVTEALAELSLPELQIAEVLALRAAGTRRSQLARLLDVAVEDADLTRLLQRLEDHALAWSDDDGWIRTAPIHEVIVGGYGFGPSARIELRDSSLEQLQRMAYELGAPVGRRREALLDAVCAALADADIVRAQFLTAPEQTQEVLLTLATGEPFYFDPRQMSALRNDRPSPLRWAIERGMLAWSDYSMAAVLPSEVGVALRPDFTAEFDPAPPLQPSVEVAVEIIERDSAAAVRSALASMTALLDLCSRTPVPMLKNGGVGTRELRRIAKTVGDGNEIDLRLWLVLAGVSGLIGVTGNAIAPSEHYDDWLKLDPPAQYAELLRRWLVMDASPLDTRSAALLRTEDDEAVSAQRRSLVAVLTGIPEGFGLPDLESLNTLQVYLRPLLTGADPEAALPMTQMLWRELQLLGLGSLYSATMLCRVLAAEAGLSDDAGTLPDLGEVLTRMLPAAQRTVLLQSDLTAIATGAPAADLAEFLDLAADRESRGGGYTWRFSESSIRRAFDTGLGATELLTALRAAATGGRVPQPLEYLVADLARRHGGLRVRPVGSVLRSEDTALLAELPKVKSLAALGLTELAPTVYASVLPVDRTLAALRAAGYAPAGEHADGTIALERVTRHRVSHDSGQ